MKIPAMPVRGKPIEADYRDMVNFVRSLRIASVKGGRFKVTPNGTEIEILPSKQQSSPSTPLSLPLTVARGMTDDPTPVAGLTVSGGAYQVGAAGEWVTIPPTTIAEGVHAYFVVVQDPAREVTTATVSV